MKRWVSVLAIVALCSSSLAADVTVTSNVTIEGGAPGMAGAGGTSSPRMTMKIKGLKARSDVDVNGQTQTSITDLAAKQVIVLQHAQKTAQVYASGSMPAATAAVAAAAKIDASSKPTGNTRTIAGTPCDEFAIRMGMNMADFAASPGLPPQAAEMMKGARMVVTGSIWVAKSGPGVADFVAFQKAAANANMAAAIGGVVPGMQAGGLERLLKSLSEMPGIPYLTELQMNVEGTGPMVDAMKQMGGMTIMSAVTEVSTTAITDDQFQVPADYKTVKQ
jgi:hypothetical protein